MKYVKIKISLFAAAFLLSGMPSFALPPCPGSSSLVWTDCSGSIGYQNKNSYTGEWKDGQHDGHGAYTFGSGNIYVGEFENNLFNGQGKYTFANENSYFGSFKDGKRHGQGTYTYENGSQYVGAF